jgi:hypothetical protein
LASPDDFIPATPDWRDKSPLIASVGKVQYFHYDLALQALSKLERHHEQDVEDVRNLLCGGYVAVEELSRKFARIESQLLHYPAIDAKDFRRKMEDFLRGVSRKMGSENSEGILPGNDLISQGLADLARGEVSQHAVLLLVARPRLRRLGIKIPEQPLLKPYEHALYIRIEERLGHGAHSYYNSLLRRIDSYAHALEREHGRL